MVTGALSIKVVSMGSLDYLSVANEIHALESMFMQLSISTRGGVLYCIEAKSMFMEEIKDKQFKYGS